MSSFSSSTSSSFSSSQCHNYHTGTIVGTLCEPLCTSKTIEYRRCFPGGRDKAFVAKVKWGTRDIILKSLETNMKLTEEEMTADEYFKKVQLYI